MASMFKYGSGLRRIEFNYTPSGARTVIRLGRISSKAANTAKAYIDRLIEDQVLNRVHDAETMQWLAGVDEKLLSRLRAAGLADGVGVTQTTLREFLTRVEENQRVKAGTATFYGHTRRNLLSYFTGDRLLSTIKESDTDAFKAWLSKNQELADATVSRRIIAARTMWRMAIRWQLIKSNPFDGIRGGTQQNASRQRFITQASIEKVIEACPDAEWRALIGLARYGGLRTPSEPLALKWSEINWAEGEMLVHSAKTAHHDGKATRVVPLFPELRALLMEALEVKQDNSDDYVMTRYRDPKQNLRTQFQRIIKRAGLSPWPRLWQNLRASRETELMRDYDLATVCKWIGNSPAVAAKHYAMSTDLNADFRRAAGLQAPELAAEKAQQKAQHSAQQTASAGERQGKTCDPENNAKSSKDNAFDSSCPEVADRVKGVEWAWQDSNLRPHPYQ